MWVVRVEKEEPPFFIGMYLILSYRVLKWLFDVLLYDGENLLYNGGIILVLQ